MNNRKYVCKNPYQGEYKRVLCCCSAGVLRSPTAAEVLSQKFNCNTRACVVDIGHALIPIDEVLVEWADEIVVMLAMQERQIKQMFPDISKPIVVLGIPDQFEFRNSNLIKMIEEGYTEHLLKERQKTEEPTDTST